MGSPPEGSDAQESPYTLTLTSEQRAELEARARRYTLPYRDVGRAKIVLMAALGSTTTRSRPASTPAGRSCRSGASDSSKSGSPGWRSALGMADPWFFPPEVVVEVKAMACELPKRLGVPLSRLHVPDIRAEVSPRPRRRDLRHDDVAMARLRTPSGLGVAVRGSFPATPISRPRPVACWTCMLANGRASRWETGLRHLCRREDLDPGPPSLPSNAAARPGGRAAGRT